MYELSCLHKEYQLHDNTHLQKFQPNQEESNHINLTSCKLCIFRNPNIIMIIILGAEINLKVLRWLIRNIKERPLTDLAQY